MSKGAKALFAVCLLGIVAGCAPKEKEVVYVETPVAPEPVTQKY
ncbi:hypothetical protein ABIE69_000249 [Rhodobacteraceae bacterium MBR-64]|jgi:hypothetical protein